MSRTKLFKKQFSTNLRLLEWAFVNYYGHKHTKDRSEVIRRMVSRYVDADRSFDPTAFASYVKRELLKTEEDKELRQEIQRQVEQYIQERLGEDSPTLTGSRSTKGS